jgi:hypothetical protein
MKRKKQILKEIKNLVMEYKSINERSDIPEFKKAIGKTIKNIKHIESVGYDSVEITLSDGSVMSLTSEGDDAYIMFDYFK